MGTEKVIDTTIKLREILSEQRKDRKIVCTIGSWDILHRGHVEYLAKAKHLGDLLVVGVDSDVAFNRYKRRPPMYPEQDRVRIVASLEYVDYISLIHDVNEDGEWQMELVKTIVPDVFLCTNQSFSEGQRKKLKELCRETVTVDFLYSDSPSVLMSMRMKETVLREGESKIEMRQRAFWLIIGLLSLSVVTTLVTVLLTAFKIAALPEAVLLLLIGKTIPELLGTWYLVVKYLFPSEAEKTPK